MKIAERFVDAIAKKAAARVVRLTIRCLQRMKEGIMSGEDSGLDNVWDEICVQVQHQQSVLWDAYDSTVRGIVASAVGHLDPLDLEAVWLQTSHGFDWWYDEDERDQAGASEPAPISTDDVVEYLIVQTYNQAANWSNPRIRAFLNSQFEMDD